jgi:hypothetical protein
MQQRGLLQRKHRQAIKLSGVKESIEKRRIKMIFLAD